MWTMRSISSIPRKLAAEATNSNLDARESETLREETREARNVEKKAVSSSIARPGARTAYQACPEASRAWARAWESTCTNR